MFENLGVGEILIIVLIVVILFGGKKIPELARGLGKGINEFKKGLSGSGEEEKASDTKKQKDDKKE